MSVVVLDRETFPRTKLCAGWITPEVVDDLDFSPRDYPYRFNTFESVVVHLFGLTLRLKSPQHSIRRLEFDAYLLERSGSEVQRHTVKTICIEAGEYIIDDTYRCRYLVGAGGARCPVYRVLFRAANPRARELQAVTYEHEFPYEWADQRCHLWFFRHGLPGYSWYVPKGDGYLNCGIGGMAQPLKLRAEDIRSHWRAFAKLLSEQNFVADLAGQPKGYSYYLRGNVDTVRIGNAFITGDAAGLATRDFCEGIGPAVRSGQRAAQAITTGSEYRLADLNAFSSEIALVRKFLEYMFVKRGVKVPKPGASLASSSQSGRRFRA